MRYRAMVCGPVIGSAAAGDAFRPKITDDYPMISWCDITCRDSLEMPGNPALMIIETELDENQLIILEKDELYIILSVDEVIDYGTQTE